ncbi:MAG: nickel-responsive transcriptional regulator NikR [Methanobacteriaceae archaeon]|nr:nickel-responsive transcriptional regulator NikR [Methanobacteriaceae archaeon]
MRISMSLPKKLLSEFDDVLKDRGYNSRSKGIRDALKDYIVRYQWMKDIEGDRVGIVAVIYDHHYTGVMEDITEIQHQYRSHINATMHLHISDRNCLEVIIVKGDAQEIRNLTEKIMRLKGVEHVKLTTTASSKE